MDSGPHRVIVVGGGFGGIRAARTIARASNVDVTLVDRVNHHLFQPLLYQVATAALSAGEVAPALRSMFRDRANVRVVLAEVTDIDVARRIVHATSGEHLELPYDTLVVAAGATHSYFGRDEWAEFAGGMKTLDDAFRLRSRILGAYELAETMEDPTLRDALLTFTVVGAGATGVELAGQLATLARRTFRGEYRTIDPRRARVVLVEAGPTVLAPYEEKLRLRAVRDLEGLGVEVLVGHRVVHIDEHGVDVEAAGERTNIASKTVIWAAGVKASPLASLLARATGAPLDRAGRIGVEPDLSLVGHPEIFGVGDMISLPNVPGVAPAAIQMGKYVGLVVRARLEGKAAPPPFRYRDKGSMAITGPAHAIAKIGRVSVSGFLAFLLWAFVHLVYLIGWERRIETVLRWLTSLFTRHRAERLISVTSLVSEERARADLTARLDAALKRPA